MSGGHWNYQNRDIQDFADNCDYIKEILGKAAETAHIIDYAESGDTLRKDARKEIYELWRDFFEEKYLK